MTEVLSARTGDARLSANKTAPEAHKTALCIAHTTIAAPIPTA